MHVRNACSSQPEKVYAMAQEAGLKVYTDECFSPLFWCENYEKIV